MQVAVMRMIGVGGLDDRRVLAVFDPDVAGGVHDDSTHGGVLLTCWRVADVDAASATASCGAAAACGRARMSAAGRRRRRGATATVVTSRAGGC